MPQPRARPNLRPDHNGTQRAQFESHKKKIYATQKVADNSGGRTFGNNRSGGSTKVTSCM